MRFFTNENKDETDPKDVDVKERGGYHNDATESADTVALPQQRGNSPWSSTPDGTTDQDGSRDQDGTPDQDVDPDHDASHRRDEGDEPLIEDPTPPDHAAADTEPDALATETKADNDAEKDWAGPTADPRDEDDDETTDGKGATLKDSGDFDDPKVVDEHVETTDGKGATLKDDGDFDDPDVTTTDTAVVVAEPEPVPAATAAAVPDAPVTTEPADTPVPVAAAKPGEVDAPAVTTIFDTDDAKAFQDRWRDVQLRFVDSPKEATAEAATLVDDAVEKLTASLRTQKDQFGGESTEDTEKLRVELRGYRDLFNRIIGL